MRSDKYTMGRAIVPRRHFNDTFEGRGKMGLIDKTAKRGNVHMVHLRPREQALTAPDFLFQNILMRRHQRGRLETGEKPRPAHAGDVRQLRNAYAGLQIGFDVVHNDTHLPRIQRFRNPGIDRGSARRRMMM